MSLLSFLFGCSHSRLTFPQTRTVNRHKQTYVACLDCGKQFPYDWGRMRLGTPVAARVPVGDVARAAR